MPRKGQLFRNREDADFRPLLRFKGGIARQNEGGLGKIHLARERLHFVIIQSASVSENRERIASQRPLGEDINLNEFISAVRHKNSSTWHQGTRKINT